MRGRKPKPAGQQIALGDPRKRGANKLNEAKAAEPQPTRGIPPCPPHVSGLARKAWNFWAQQLEAMKLDYQCDAMVLEGACINYAHAVQADKIIEKEGPIVTISEFVKTGEDDRGEPVFTSVVLKIQKHPAVSVSNAAWLRVRSFCSEMGLSLVSRTRLSIEKTDRQEDDLAALLRAPREPVKPSVQ